MIGKVDEDLFPPALAEYYQLLIGKSLNIGVRFSVTMLA
jgi:hypothetical protein